MCSDRKAASQLCAMYSFTGILFMGWVGLMITYQPFFITGLEDVEHCRHSAFGAMGTFIFTFGLSIFYLCYDATCGRWSRYDEVALNEHADGPGFPVGMTDYDVNMEMTQMAAARSRPTVLVAGMKKSGSAASSAHGSAYSDAVPPPSSAAAAAAPSSSGGYSDTPPQQQHEENDEEEEEEGEFAATPTASSSAHSGPPVDLLS